LEEGQELWGVYVFKRGFGGYAIRSLETHDLIYQPLVYNVYMRLLEVKRRRDEKRNLREQHPGPSPSSGEKTTVSKAQE
jgi:peptidoglycan pentaglycine glycine transferase (the first glycine)